MSDQQFIALLSALIDRGRRYTESLYAIPPDPFRQVPIYLEHTSRIVGWGSVAVDDEALRVKNALITDKEACRQLDNDELKGFSIAGLVHNAICSVCNAQYVDCNHITGNTYDGVACLVHILGIDLAEVSLVKNPVNIAAVIEKVY
jgi:hypothetical protein